MKIVKKAAVLGVLVVLASTTAHAGTVYSSLDHNDEFVGCYGSGVAYGDEVTLDAPGAIIEGMTLSFDSVSKFSYGPSSFEVSFFHVNAGSDGAYQTADDTIGSMIGAPFTETGVTIASDTTHTIDFDGLSYEVPQNFVWRVENGDDFSYLLNSSRETEMTGGSANPNIMWADYDNSAWEGNEPQPGNEPYYYDYDGDGEYNPSVAFQGVATPEPGTTALALLAAGAGVFAVWRKRSKGED